MRLELRVIGPVFLVLLAGYLSTSFSDHDLSFGSFSPTGAAITTVQTCPADHILFKVSHDGNAHAAVATDTTYGYAVCWDGQGSTNRACNTNNFVARLSADSNAHVEKKNGAGNYPTSICFGNLQCDVKPKGQCSSLGQTWRCVASLSGETNAHVSACGTYDYDLCCSDGGSVGGSRKDTDLDTVFDEGLGATKNTPCNPKIHAAPYSTCADNCIAIPNTNQTDTDSDGAGDVCDSFPSDSCSILLPDDNCPHKQQCKNLAAQWSILSALEGEPVSLSVTGSAECGGKLALFQVFDKDNRNWLIQSPQPTTFTNGSNSTSVSSPWIAEYSLNISNQYYFQATITGGSSQIQITSPLDKLLKVEKRPPGQAVCGNGRVEGSNNEQCDDGNTKNGDGCSSNCTREGNFTGGKSCQDDLKCKGVPATYMVCQSDLTQAYFCLTGSGGCKVLSNPLPCGKEASVQKVCVRGADSCKSPTCNFQYAKSSCANGQQTITCTATGGDHCTCGTGYPKTVSCTAAHEEEPFPVFSGWNIVVTITLLIIFYSFRRGARWKSK